MSIIKKPHIPPLQDGEHIILQSQGAYRGNSRSGWKIARCFLTNRRFIICRGSTPGIDILLDDITNLLVENVHYVMKNREALCVFFNSKEGSLKKRIWVVTPDLDDWKKKIYQASLLNVDMETVEKIAGGLDHDGQDILWYLWDKHYARIEQLAELIDAPNHMHVLINIRETINPVAEKMIGCPILSFERSKVDPETGESVLFSWWLMGDPDKRAHNDERMLDIFDEESCIQVVMEVRGIEESDLRLEIDGDLLSVRSIKAGSTWEETITLPAGIKPDSPQMRLKNNLLEIRLSKSGQ